MDSKFISLRIHFIVQAELIYDNIWNDSERISETQERLPFKLVVSMK